MTQSTVVYFSKFGNTRMVAERIAQVLASAGPVQLLSSDDLTVSAIQKTELMIMGTPTHKMNLPLNVKPVLEELPRKSFKGISFAAFDTSYKMSWWLNHFTAAKRLAKKLKRLGGRRLVPPETFHVMGREGPLYEGELERAETWATAVLGKSQQT